MNVLTRVVSGLRALFTRNLLGPYGLNDPILNRLFGGTPVTSGVSVTEDTALNYSAVWAAVNLISGALSSLPLILYRRLPNGGKERYTDHPLYALLDDEPNPEMSSMIFRETLQAHVLTWGNGFAWIQRDQAGRPIGLWPLTPNRVQPFRTDRGSELRYRIDNAEVLTASEVLHVQGMGFDGVTGYSVIRRHREAIGLGLATAFSGARRAPT